MERRIKAVSSMPLTDGFGITAVQDDEGCWRLGSLNHGFDSISVEIRDEDRERCFDSAQALLCYFRQHYAPLLARGTKIKRLWL